MCIEHRRQRGVTLIELIVFIVIVSVGLVGILSVLNLTTRSSADPLIRKQMLAIAEGLLDEVAAQPFTWCDPDDPAAATAISAAACATPENLGPEAGETRNGAVTPFDNVNDYNGLVGITSGLTGTAFPPGYSAAVTVTPTALGVGVNTVPAAASLLINVTVSFGNERLTVEGFRTRYAPNYGP
jgi:MSHA pilin protein MshD